MQIILWFWIFMFMMLIDSTYDHIIISMVAESKINFEMEFQRK
jgi:hypothetical protein